MDDFKCLYKIHNGRIRTLNWSNTGLYLSSNPFIVKKQRTNQLEQKLNGEVVVKLLIINGWEDMDLGHLEALI